MTREAKLVGGESDASAFSIMANAHFATGFVPRAVQNAGEG